jgi:hypothetical protein
MFSHTKTPFYTAVKYSDVVFFSCFAKSEKRRGEKWSGEKRMEQ